MAELTVTRPQANYIKTLKAAMQVGGYHEHQAKILLAFSQAGSPSGWLPDFTTGETYGDCLDRINKELSSNGWTL